LFSLLIVIAIASIALGVRSCSAPKYPAFIDPKISLDEAQARSKESGKPVFALVAADWCTHCAALKSGALADRRVAAWIKENTEPVYVDATRLSPDTGIQQNRQDPELMALMSRLRVNSLPAMILLSKGAEIGHVEGEMPTGDVLKWLEGSGVGKQR